MKRVIFKEVKILDDNQNKRVEDVIPDTIKKVMIKGVEYTIKIANHSKSESAKQLDQLDSDGLCLGCEPIIYVNGPQLMYGRYVNGHTESLKRECINRFHHLLRHEIIHAFFKQSGLQENAHSLSSDIGYPQNEELVEWLAANIPDIVKVYDELGISDKYSDIDTCVYF